MNIAVMLTCFNRRDKTLACLNSLHAQRLASGIKFQVHLTDDGSSDGTAAAVKKHFPDTRVYHGTGSFFWAGGMRHTWKKALETSADYYLLLNDDTFLEPDALQRLIVLSEETRNTHGKPALGIGSTRDQDTGNWSYGGYKLHAEKQWKSSRSHSSTETVDCDFANANILLIPAEVTDAIGILSENFTHALADYDYTLNARKAGFPLRVAAGYCGVCTDDHGNNWKPAGSSLKERIRYLMSPKGLAYKEYLYFIRRHFPYSYPSAFAKLWMKTFFPFIWDNFKK